jgi:lysophospholipase L1-like esterase
MAPAFRPEPLIPVLDNGEVGMTEDIDRSGGCPFAAPRGGFAHFHRALAQDRPVTVAFMGGSITEGYGATDPEKTSWRALIATYLTRKFPHKEFRFVNAGVGGTDSAFGAHRLQEHVLNSGAVDLIFVEFAVNDGDDRDRSVKGMEGIVRQFKRQSPQSDLCFLYAAADKNLAEELPFNIAIHEEIAEHYGIPSVNFAAGIRTLIREGRCRWEDLAPDRIHPNDEGYALYTGFLKDFLERQLAVSGRWKEIKQEENHQLPVPLRPDNYEYGSMLDIGHAERISGFRVQALKSEPIINWRFSTAHLYAEEPGAELAFTVRGRGAGVLLLCGPDSGIFEFAVNGAPFRKVNLFDEWCLRAFRPVAALFPDQERSGPMEVVIRNTDMKDERSAGTTLRILKFLCH